MMSNQYDQLFLLKNHYYQFFNFKELNFLNNVFCEFENQFLQIYHNKGYEVKSYVQFNKIKVCFNLLDDIIQFFKKHAQKNKRVVLLAKIYPLEKFYELLHNSYVSDVQKLYVNHGYRTRLIKLDDENDTYIRPIQKSS